MGARRHTRWFATHGALCAVTVSWLLCFAPRAFSQNVQYAEYNVKLAFLYNFARFVQWPADAFAGDSAPLTLCVVGHNPFKGEIEDGLQSRTVAGHPIRIERVVPGGNPKDCQMMFVPSGQDRAGEKVLAALKGSNTLTVGESHGFAERGGIINFVLRDDDKLGFEINISAANDAGLKISSKLLRLAKTVK